MNNFRVGHGFDVHNFTQGDHLILGGVKIPYHQAFKAHSDGDVLIHAICDALLGALALGDIGIHFPDTSSDFKNINSRILLRQVHTLMKQKGYQIGNLDGTIIAQSPKMQPHIQKMRQNLANDLKCRLDQINIKATTTEKLGFVGRKEGISAHAVVIVGNE